MLLQLLLAAAAAAGCRRPYPPPFVPSLPARRCCRRSWYFLLFQARRLPESFMGHSDFRMIDSLFGAARTPGAIAAEVGGVAGRGGLEGGPGWRVWTLGAQTVLRAGGTGEDLVQLQVRTLRPQDVERYKQALGRRGALTAAVNYYRASFDNATRHPIPVVDR